jgi:hypothetical protein
MSDLRARLAQLPRETLRQILEAAVAPPTQNEATAADGSRVIRVPVDGGRTLAFRLSADDLAL